MSPTLPHLVIAGGSGFLGLTWAAAMQDRFRVTLIQNDRHIVAPFATIVHADLSDPIVTQDMLTALAPDILINAAGITNVEACEADPDAARLINAILPQQLASFSATHNAQFVHISTDHLFDGSGTNLPETATISPLNVYATTKADGETRVLAVNKSALVLRTNFFGCGPAHKASFSDVILTALRAGEAIDLFEDTWFTPIFSQDLVMLAHRLIDQGASGLFNLVGPERLTKLDFGRRLARAFDLEEAQIRASRLADRDDLTPRPTDMSLDDGKLTSILGRGAPELEDAFQRMRVGEADNSVRRIGRTMIPYGRHFLDDDDIEAVGTFLKAGQWLTQGPTVVAFEEEIARLAGARYGVAVSSATAGLHIAALAAGLGPGSKMITSPVTFVASANAASYCGAEVVFCDIDPETANLCPRQVEAALAADPSIRAIMPVHFGGLPCDMTRLRALADQYNVSLIEDAAHALGGNYACGADVGSGRYGDMAVFSFHPVKAIALGEGGLVTTNDEDLYRKLLRLRSHGINKLDDEFEHPEEAGPWYYEMQQLGYNYRITDLQCALGLSQAKKLPGFVKRRRMLAARYDASFQGWSHVKPAQSVDKTASAHHIYVLQIDFAGLGATRAKFMTDLREMGVGSQVHYVPVPMQPYYRKLGHDMSALPNAAAYYGRALTIPLFFGLAEREQDQVIQALAILTGNDNLASDIA